MDQNIQYQLNVQLVDNTVTVDDKDDKIFAVVSNGTADKDRIVAEMVAVNPGLEEETIRMVVDLENRVIRRLLLSGMRVNTGLYQAEILCKGVTYNATWDKSANSLYASFTQGKDLREALKQARVNVIGERGDAIYLAGGESTRGQGYNALSGRPFTLYGKNIKLAGEDPSVGITLTDSEGHTTAVEPDMIALNDPSKVIFLVPAGLEDGEYQLKLTTQFCDASKLLKSPRHVEQTIYIGESYEPTPGTEEGDDPTA